MLANEARTNLQGVVVLMAVDIFKHFLFVRFSYLDTDRCIKSMVCYRDLFLMLLENSHGHFLVPDKDQQVSGEVSQMILTRNGG